MKLDRIADAQAQANLFDDYSLEMTAKDVAALQEAGGEIPAGTQISVTFLPGEDVDARVHAAVTARKLGYMPIPHLSARRLASEAELDEFLTRLVSEAQADSVFVVAGDPKEPMGPYEDALAIIKSGLLVKHGIRKVGISGYAEGHPDISEAKLWQALADKTEALHGLGQDFEIVTQFGFDADPMLAWIARVRETGITERIRIGIPGPASAKTLLRFAARCGVGVSAKVMSKYGLSLTQLLGTAGPDALIEALTAQWEPGVHGDVRLHFYPFGGLGKTADWVARRR